MQDDINMVAWEEKVHKSQNNPIEKIIMPKTYELIGVPSMSTWSQVVNSGKV